MNAPTISIRTATPDDAPRVRELIKRSAVELTSGDYPVETVKHALRSGRFGLDPRLILDCTYYLVFVDQTLAACGGWSFRRTLHSVNPDASSDLEVLDPSVHPARIRAFFVHPCHARRGLGTLLLTCCESAGRIAGFGAFELVATAGGERLYRASGYTSIAPYEHAVGDGLSMQGVLMRKTLRRSSGAFSTAEPQISTLDTTLTSTTSA